MFNHVIVEGSSSARNYNDESGKHGFVGRIDEQLRQHCQEIKRQANWETVADWTYFSNHAQVGRHLPSWVESAESHIVESLRRTRRKERAHCLGIFILEGHPLYLERHYSNKRDTLEQVWQRSLERLVENCTNYDVDALFIQMPAPERNIGKRGHEIHQSLANLTLEVAATMDNAATVVDVTTMFDGYSVEPFLADDRMHPNARGHELIYRNIIPKIYDKLEIEPLQPLDDPAELLEASAL